MSSNIRRQYTRTDLIWYQEDFLQYQPGGYHTVTIGDTLHQGRYCVRHKLGWGAFATVWLAKDLRTSRRVAIKIIRADHSEHVREHKALLNLLSGSSGSPEQAFVSQILDHFTHHGPNGDHVCLVFELLGPTVYQMIEACRGAAERDEGSYHGILKPLLILKITRQLLTAVAYIHSHGYVHGDISTKNIAFTTRRMSQLNEHDFFEILGTPRTETLARRDGKPLEAGIPSQLVENTRWLNWEDERYEDVRLFDFDGSFPQTGPKAKTICQPIQFRAPESLLMSDLDSRSDLWSLGIVLYTLIFSVEPIFGGPAATSIPQMVQLVGDFPPEWRTLLEEATGKERIDISTDDNVLPRLERDFKSLRSRTLKPLLPVVRGLLRMRPADRITAQEALEMIAPKPKEQGPELKTRHSPRRPGLRRRVRKPVKT